MQEIKVGPLRTKILKMMAKYIGIDDLGYVIANVISEERAAEVEYEFEHLSKDKEFKGTYILSIKLSKGGNSK